MGMEPTQNPSILLPLLRKRLLVFVYICLEDLELQYLLLYHMKLRPETKREDAKPIDQGEKNEL